MKAVKPITYFEGHLIEELNNNLSGNELYKHLEEAARESGFDCWYNFKNDFIRTDFKKTYFVNVLGGFSVYDKKRYAGDNVIDLSKINLFPFFNKPSELLEAYISFKEFFFQALEKIFKEYNSEPIKKLFDTVHKQIKAASNLYGYLNEHYGNVVFSLLDEMVFDFILPDHNFRINAYFDDRLSGLHEFSFIEDDDISIDSILNYNISISMLYGPTTLEYNYSKIKEIVDQVLLSAMYSTEHPSLSDVEYIRNVNGENTYEIRYMDNNLDLYKDTKGVCYLMDYNEKVEMQSTQPNKLAELVNTPSKR